jgi:hypothetical protein
VSAYRKLQAENRQEAGGVAGFASEQTGWCEMFVDKHKAGVIARLNGSFYTSAFSLYLFVSICN